VDQADRWARELAAEPFVDLVTFRSDGSPAHTPVWVSGDGRSLFISTFGHSYKVRRAAANPLVAVAACNGYGSLLPDAVYVAGRAEVLDRSEFRPGVRGHRAKYGTHFSLMWPARWPLRLIGKKRVWIVVRPTPDVTLPSIPPPVIEPPPPGR
jgi:PPOX class probable F420-dependent enzyme